jgi:hypothetical protein
MASVARFTFHGRGISPKMEYVKLTLRRLEENSFRGGSVLEASGLKVALGLLQDNVFHNSITVRRTALVEQT